MTFQHIPQRHSSKSTLFATGITTTTSTTLNETITFHVPPLLLLQRPFGNSRRFRRRYKSLFRRVLTLPSLVENLTGRVMRRLFPAAAAASTLPSPSLFPFLPFAGRLCSLSVCDAPPSSLIFSPLYRVPLSLSLSLSPTFYASCVCASKRENFEI